MTAIAVAARPSQRWFMTALGALALSGVLAASAHASIPFWPVPMTLQPLAVLLIAAFAGPRLAVAAYVVYLIEGAAGLPVFAGTPARGIGLAYMAGPTGGYIAGQLVASGLVGWMLARFGRNPVAVVATMIAGIAAMYALGVAWLSGFVGWDRVFALGVAPFLVGDAVKVGIASLAVLALRPNRA
jgi:biotin transport system substrate-specific component